jgi:hypothetical protein
LDDDDDDDDDDNINFGKVLQYKISATKESRLL